MIIGTTKGKIKRIIEVKRGELVPSDAIWLKDIVRQVSVKQEWDDDGMCASYVEVPVYATFDVFEVLEDK